MMATENIAKICSLGFFTKGLVYLLVGVLTFMAAFNWGGSISSSSNVVRFLMDLLMGQVLVGTTSIGLLAYSLWRFYEIILVQKDTNEEKIKGGFKMIRYLLRYFLFNHSLFICQTINKCMERRRRFAGGGAKWR